MQEIRDYIYGMLKCKWTTYLYHLPQHKHIWVFDDAKPLEKLQLMVKNAKGSGESFHIIGGVVTIRDKNGDLGDPIGVEPPPDRVYAKMIAPTIIKVFVGESTKVYSTWGIWYDEPNWRLIGIGLPKIADLEKLRRRGKFDKIRVCQYIPEYLCLESCEMRIWDRDENRLV